MNDPIQTLVILIPGNPSVPGVYEPFLNAVVSKLSQNREQVKGIVLPHLGQCNTHLRRIKTINLFDVVEEHKKNILNHLQNYQAEEVILIGHSLGGAVTLLLQDELHDAIDRFIFLCPFLGPSARNTSYLKLFKNPITRFGLKYGSYTILSNQIVANRFFIKWLGENPQNKNIIKQIKKPNYIHNFFTLVSGYFRDFHKVNLRHKVTNMDSDKSYFVFARDDFWVPPEVVQKLPNAIRYSVLDDISHDFCLVEKQFQQVAQSIHKYLEPISKMA
ncbi:MAG: alpha/beta fold hydrolase [Spirochaetota bacterium]